MLRRKWKCKYSTRSINIHIFNNTFWLNGDRQRATIYSLFFFLFLSPESQLKTANENVVLKRRRDIASLLIDGLFPSTRGFVPMYVTGCIVVCTCTRTLYTYIHTHTQFKFKILFFNSCNCNVFTSSLTVYINTNINGSEFKYISRSILSFIIWMSLLFYLKYQCVCTYH